MPRKEDVFAVAFFIAFAGAWWWPLPLHLTDGQLEVPPIDAAFNEWILGWGVHALTTDPLGYFDANMFHPFDNTLAWGDHLFGIVLFAVPLVPVLGVVGAYNTLLIASTALSGFTAYKLGHEVTGSRRAGAIVGVLWVTSASRVLELTHIQILSTQWIPLVFLYGERLRKGERRSRGTVVGLAIAAWLVLVTNVYLAIYTVLSFAVWLAVASGLRSVRLRAAVQMAVAWTAAAVMALPLYIPSLGVRGTGGGRRGLAEQSGAALDALLPLPMPGHPAQNVFGAVSPSHFRYDTIGLAALVLLVTGVALAVRTCLPYLITGLFGVISAQGPTFRWYGSVLADNPVFLAAYHVVPGYDAMRVPARWFVVAMLFLAVAAGAGAARLLQERPVWVGRAAAGAVAAFVLFEQAPLPVFVGDDYRLDDRPAYAWLADDAGDDVLLELPISADLGGHQTQVMEGKRMLLSTHHWKRRVAGGISPVIHDRYGPNALVLDQLGVDPRAERLVRRFGVDFVLVVREDFDLLGRTDADAVIARLDALPTLQRVRDFGDAVLYRATYDLEWSTDG